MEQNGTGRRTRRRYSPVEKVKIQREYTWRISTAESAVGKTRDKFE